MIPRVVKGQRPSASHQNKIVDKVNTLSTNPGPGAVGIDQAGQKVFVINQTGMDLEIGMVAPFKPSAANPYEDNPLRQISGTVGALYDPTTWETEDTDGDDPPWNNWVVMAQRIPDGQSGWAYASGVVLARVRNEEAGSASLSYQYADLSTWEEGGGGSGGTVWYHLNRAPSGGARVLWVGDSYDGTGSADGDTFQWALIRFSGVTDQAVLYTVVQDEADYTTGQRLRADGTLEPLEEYFAPSPTGTLAIPVRTSDGRTVLFQGGGSATLQVVQVTSAASQEDGTVTVKNVSIKSDPTASPNYELSGDAYLVNFFKE